MEQSNSPPASIGETQHNVTVKHLLQWWQIPTRLGLRGARNRNATKPVAPAYNNPAIQIILPTIIAFPFYLWNGIRLHSPASTIAVGCAMWLCLIVLLVLFFDRQRKHITGVRTTESGLDLRSPLLHRNINYWDIEDFFLAAAGDSNGSEMVIQCKDGQEFLLPLELERSDMLFDTIKKRSGLSRTEYAINYRVPDGFRELNYACLVALLGALAMASTHGMSPPHNAADWIALVFLGCVFLGGLLWCWLNLAKNPQLVRVGKQGILLKTGKRGCKLEWHEITACRTIGVWIIIRSSGNWFALLVDRKGPLAEKLLENRSLPPNR